MMPEYTEAEALTEARRRYGHLAVPLSSRQVVAEHHLESDVSVEHYRVGVIHFIGVMFEGRGKSWEEAFRKADAALAEVEREKAERERWWQEKDREWEREWQS